MEKNPEIKAAIKNADPMLQGYISHLEKRIQSLLRDLGKKEAEFFEERQKIHLQHEDEIKKLREELGNPMSPQEAYERLIKNPILKRD